MFAAPFQHRAVLVAIVVFLALPSYRPRGSAEETAEAPRPSEERIAEWISELRADRLATRQAASRALIEAAPWSVPQVHRAKKDKELEVRVRAAQIAKASADRGAKVLESQGVSVQRRPDGSVRTIAVPKEGKHQFTDQSMHWLQVFPELVALHIRNAPVTDDGLSYLKSVPALQSLRLEGTKITDNGISHINVLEALETLTLDRNVRFRGSGLRFLTKTASLQRIGLYRCPLTACHLAKTAITLRQLPKLQRLTFIGPMDGDVIAHELEQFGDSPRPLHLAFIDTALTNSGLESLSKVTCIEGLDVRGADITNGGISHIAKLRRLRGLRLSGMAITTKGIAPIGTLPNLQTLHVHDCRIDPKVVESIRKEWKLKVFLVD